MNETNLRTMTLLKGEELRSINGGNGGLEKIFRRTIWGTVIYFVAENWGTIKEAVNDGWNGEYGCESCK